MSHKRDFRDASERKSLSHHMEYPTGSQFLDRHNVTFATDKFNAVERRFLKSLGYTMGWDKAGFIHKLWQVAVWQSDHAPKGSLVHGVVRIKQLNTIRAKLPHLKRIDDCLKEGMRS